MTHTIKCTAKRTAVFITALAVAFVALFGFMPQTARAADNWIQKGDFLVSGTGYVYNDGVLTINTNGANLKVKNADPNTPTANRIVVETAAKITLCGVNIDVSSKDDESAFMIADNVTEQVNIYTTNNKNILKSGNNCAGLQKNGSSGALTINGDAILEAIGGDYGAGIGGGNRKSCTKITVNIGVVIARGGNGAAGIGGGYKGSGSDIKLESSIVTAIGGKGGAGIGGGEEAIGKNITIGNSSVKAVAGKGANDIGNGSDVSGNNLPTNSSGTPVYPIPIYNPKGERIILEGNSVYMISTHKMIDPEDDVCYAYLTGEDRTIKVGSTVLECHFDSTTNTLWTVGFNFEITTVDGTPPVHGTDYTYRTDDGILKILKGNSYIIKNLNPNRATTDTIVVSKNIGASITLEGVNIDVSGINNACAFKIEDDNANEVVITLAKDTENYLKSGTGCAGLQKNGGGRLTFEGEGSLEATGGNHGAGIGGGNGGSSSNIIINNGTVTATGGQNGAGIGGGGIGDGSSGSNITISGGTVTATSGFSGAGIGGGLKGDGSNITISGGTVTATVRFFGAGIGGGGGGSGSDITISGGTVAATGGEQAAGIGGGAGSVTGGSGSNITISGGTVTATGGKNGAGIGGGTGGTGSDIKISGGSVKVVAGENANAIGGGNGKSAVTPTNGTEPVYLCVIENPNSETVKIYGIPYTPNNHTAADSTDTNLYAYLTGDMQIVEIGPKRSTHYHLDNANGVFVEGKPTTTTTFDQNKFFHWLPCSTEGCTYNQFSADRHSGGTATCASKKECEICGAEYGDFDGTIHENVSTVWSKDGTYHWHECGDCHARLDETAHSGGTATCVNPKKCSECGAEYGDLDGTIHERVSTEWSKDGISHWHVCLDCNARLDETAHSGGTATCVSKKECEICGAEYGAVDGANHVNISTDWSKDGTNHWHECLECGEHVDKAAHVSSGAATSDKAEVCTVCGFEIAPATGFVAAPVISPNGSSFKSYQEVTITCATDGAEIYYTTDGTAPTTAGTKYTGAFKITETTTVKAIAVKNGMGDSTAVSATFTKKSTSGIIYNDRTDRGQTNPTLNGRSAGWSSIAEEIAKMANGSEITIELNGNYVVPADVIKAISDKDIKAAFIIESWRSWYLDGAQIEAPAAADLTVLQVDSLDSSSLRGTAGVKFRINGTANPTALKVAFKTEYADSFANLYRKDGGRLVFVGTARVGANGEAMVSASDKGDYVIMLSEYSDLPGDMNNDGKLTISDALAILKYSVDLIKDDNILAADIDGDGSISVRDAYAALRMSVGLI